MQYNRFALNDLSHQKNLNFQTPISHHKLSNSAQQNKNQQQGNQYLLQSGNEKSSSKNSLSQQLQIFQQPALQQISQQYTQQQTTQSQPQINSSPKIETPFFTTNLKNTANTNIFAQSQQNQSQMRKENIFLSSQQLQQEEPIQYKFGGSYQIFESMIGDGIKEMEQIFTQNDFAFSEDQRAEAFAGCIDIQRLQEVMEEGQTSELDIYVDNQFQNNHLQIHVPNDLFDEENAIKKSLSVLNQEYINLDKFSIQDENCDLGDDFYDQQYDENEVDTINFQKKKSYC
ncbi:hypothetical protein TTHERM_000295779 (macronuclear) [Tetrahymena thermophila SB210]|uniref:Uncharacterized protein n=1 Tax=Tetrahymena thermophila (strain SB210) TaxID=312017 RepID=W7XJ13_TETTS|nr:hypothetical protein TTHERM_000295779 [Tetrahymena thermophila SB210]EWS75101.1 hypothetical protein TTHERM_000295779 [Tetrahymena thermophila SB210]|eukprot:XP_012652339.1 hypothetical protein TTHERM_000295779 [Tetrahymena thermophila SB210]